MQEKNKQNVDLIIKRLKSIIKVDTDTLLSEAIGVSPQAINNWKKRNSIDYDIVFTICLKYRIDLNWLIFGNNPKTVTDENCYSDCYPDCYFSDKKALISEKKGIKVLPEDKSIMQPTGGIPYYEMLPASAGNFSDILNSASPTSYINLPQLEGCVAVLPVYGSSMKGLIEPGDLIAIKELKSRTEFDPSVPYLVITTEQRMIKYLRADDTDPLVIWADSTNHKPFKLDPHNILYVYAIKCVIRLF